MVCKKLEQNKSGEWVLVLPKEWIKKEKSYCHIILSGDTMIARMINSDQAEDIENYVRCYNESKKTKGKV